MSNSVIAHVQLSKQALFDHAGPGYISQTGGQVIDENFALSDVTEHVTALPSIETFVVSPVGEISSIGTNNSLNNAWLPMVELLVAQVRAWAQDGGIEIVGDSYVTASVTTASEVNGEAHFDDDQFSPNVGSGLVAIVGDLDGPRVAAVPIPHVDIAAPRPVVASEAIKTAFADGEIKFASYGPNQLVALPQFAQLHAGPGPCGTTDQVRHLLVYRAGSAGPSRT